MRSIKCACKEIKNELIKDLKQQQLDDTNNLPKNQ